MQHSFKPFFIKIALFSVFPLIIILLWQEYASPRFQTNLTWGIWLFFILSTSLIHGILVKAAQESPRKFITTFIASTGLKLFIYLIIILIYALLKRESALGFVIFFLVMYFLYSAFEITALLKYLKK
jgi:hypothetical protein